MAQFSQSAASRAAIQEAAQSYLDQLINPGNVFSLATQTFSKSQIAERLSGTSDRKSKEYKAALRRVERWVTSAKEQRKPRRSSLEQLASALHKDPQAIKAAAPGGLRMTLDASLTPGGDPKYQRMRRGIQVDFDADATAHLLVHAQDDPDEAWQDFFDQYIFPYGLVDNPIIHFS